MKTSFEKPYLLLRDKPILAHTLLALECSPLIQEIVLVVRRSRIALTKRLVRRYGLKKIVGICAGGSTRFESVWQGLQKVSPFSDFVLVHDGARPFVKRALIRRVVRGAQRYGAAVPALPVTSTVKRGKGRFVSETLVRRELWEIQTPQVFRRSLLLEGFRKARKEKRRVTDCASVVERLGRSVRLVPGDPKNLKITTQEELTFSEVLMEGKKTKLCVWG